MTVASLEHTLKSAARLRWLYVDFNSYFASVEQELDPALRGKPIAVLPVMTDATSVIAASYQAKAYGIRTGTPVYEAKRICPGLACVPARHEYYVKYHHLIRKEVERHLPISAVASIDEVACRLMDNENSVEQATALGAAIKRGLAQNVGEHIRCSIGIAPNKYLAKVATDLEKPDGFTIIQASDLPGKILPLQLRDLPGIGYNMERRIRMQGIGSMQALWDLDARRMRKIWGGVWGERMWYYLRGVELPEEEPTRSSVGHSHVLSPELREPAKARLVSRRLTLKAAARLRRMGYSAATLSLAARIENGPRLEGALGCVQAQDSMTFLAMLDWLWRKMLSEAGPGARIKKVSVTLHRLAELGQPQAELISELSEADARRRERALSMSRAMDKINHKYGRDSISVGMLPVDGRSFSGTKIAFTRIPDREEFLE